MGIKTITKMKTHYLTGLFAAVAMIGAWGCSDVKTSRSYLGEETPQVEIVIKAPAGGVSCPLYVFRRETGTGGDYVLERSYTSVADGSSMRFSLEDLRAFDYRFLMTAQPADAQWLDVKADGRELDAGTAWQDVRIMQISDNATSEAYCGVTDMTGDAILSSGRITLELKRIAGEMVFDIYRIGSSLDDPAGIVSAQVESVIDRVSDIEITYSNPTTALRFGDNNELIPASYASAPVAQDIKPVVDTGFGVSLPQSEAGLEEYDASVRGSLRIMGLFLLPSDSRIRVKMKFTYYDTTPICGNNHTGEHTAACFTENTVTLDLPAASSATGLPVERDCFTVNSAGLHADRIIDVPISGGVEADFEWSKN